MKAKEAQIAAFGSVEMASNAKPVIIKKYVTRRLYNTETGAYITHEDVVALAKSGSHFQVYDAKTGDDITRLVLMQIILEKEKAPQQNLLPIAFLRQLIRFYGAGIDLFVQRYLEMTLDMVNLERGQAPPGDPIVRRESRRKAGNGDTN